MRRAHICYSTPTTPLTGILGEKRLSGEPRQKINQFF
jgi:hypothetical protein